MFKDFPSVKTPTPILVFKKCSHPTDVYIWLCQQALKLCLLIVFPRCVDTPVVVGNKLILGTIQVKNQIFSFYSA